jgi:NAD+ synthase (glutamine-hydrolysing)
MISKVANQFPSEMPNSPFRAGFMVPLSGGIDSGCTATIVLSMCRLVMEALEDGNAEVAADMQCIVGLGNWWPKDPKELCNRILHTINMGVSGHSSEQTRSRAYRLAQKLGAHHTDMNIDNVYQAEGDLLRQYLGHTPTFASGVRAENMSLQNIQARIRMVTAYYFAQMLPSTRGRPGGGTLLVLGSINVEECLRGSLTKHNCSSAELSLIGSFSKMQIRDFVRWAKTSFELPILEEFLNATPALSWSLQASTNTTSKTWAYHTRSCTRLVSFANNIDLGHSACFRNCDFIGVARKASGRLLTLSKSSITSMASIDTR